MTTTKKPVTTTTTAPVVDNGKTPAQRLNSAVLDPKATLSAKEEKILLKYLNKIISDDMTNYEKAVACYDYIIKNTVYDYGGQILSRLFLRTVTALAQSILTFTPQCSTI